MPRDRRSRGVKNPRPFPLTHEERERHIKREKNKSRLMKKSAYWRSKVQREGQCYYCKKILEPAEVTLDHIVPLALGGKTTKGNVAVCCAQCNALKQARTPVEWLVFDGPQSSSS